MGLLKVRMATAVTCLSSMLLLGCANQYHTTSLDSGITVPLNQTLIDSNAKNDSPLIVLRWPAVIEPRARGPIAEAARSRMREAAGVTLPDSDVMGTAELIEMSANFYVAHFYWAIRKANPTARVLLEPQKITIAGRELSVSALADVPLPHDVAVHFWPIVSPEAGLASAGVAVNISVAPSRAGKNCGILFTTRLFEPLASSFFDWDCTDMSVPIDLTSSSHFLDGRNTRTSPLTPIFKAELPLEVNRTVLARIQSLDGNWALVTGTGADLQRADALAALGRSPTDYPFGSIMENYGRIVALAAKVPLKEKINLDVENYIFYLENANTKASPMISQQHGAATHNLRLAERILSEELKLRLKHDEKLALEMLSGQFAKAFIDARRQSRSDYQSYMLSIMTSGAMSILMSAQAGRSQNPSDIGGVVSAAKNVGSETNLMYKNDAVAYFRRMAPNLKLTDKTNVEFLEETVSVSVNDMVALRETLREIYQRRRLAPN